MTTNMINNSSSSTATVRKTYTIDDIIHMVRTDDKAVLRAVVAIWKRQTNDERVEKGTKWTNHFGFSKRHVTKGTMLAEKIFANKPLTAEEMADAKAIAYSYRKQLWMIASGSVPVNGTIAASN